MRSESCNVSPRGRALDLVLDSAQISLLPINSDDFIPYTYCKGESRSWLDGCLSSHELSFPAKWDLITAFSDHCPVFYMFDFQFGDFSSNQPVLTSTDWRRFEALVESCNLPSDPTSFCKLVESLVSHCTSSSAGHTACPWFNESCRQSKSNLRKARKLFHRGKISYDTLRDP